MADYEFKAASRDGYGMDWAISYSDIKPYYDRVEYEIGVSGKAGNIGGKKDERGNIFEGARKRRKKWK